jgi:hypothetical protein
MRNTYKYKPIAYHEDIRILKILHGKDDSALECMLFRSSLQSTTSTSKSDYYEYYALSYVWGGKTSRHIQLQYTMIELHAMGYKL